MSKAYIKLDHDGIKKMLRSDEAAEICRTFADKAQEKLGDGYEVTTFKGRNRANASIKAVTKKARRDNKKNNTLLKAVCGK